MEKKIGVIGGHGSPYNKKVSIRATIPIYGGNNGGTYYQTITSSEVYDYYYTSN